MELTDIILPYVGKAIDGVKKDSTSLSLTFTKKILFIKKNVVFTVHALEDISSLSVKDITGDILQNVSFKDGRITFSLTKDGVDSKYSFSFKADKLTKN